MPPLPHLLRTYAKLRFKLLGLATITDIPTDQFNCLLESLLRSCWRKTGGYGGFDAWIDYGRVRLKKDGVKLKCEWDNWTEGSIEGPKSVIQSIAEHHGLTVSDQWRWSEHDEQS